MTASRTVAVHGALAVAALIAAYMAWRHDRQVEEGGGEEETETVVVAEISRSSLKSIRYQGADRHVEIELGSEEGGPSWVTVTTKTKVPPRPRPPAKTASNDSSADGGLGADGSPLADGGPAIASDGGPAIASDGGPVVVHDADGGVEAGAGESDGGAAEPEPEIREKIVRFTANENLDEVLEKVAPLKAVRRLGKLTNEQLEEFELDDPEGSLELELTEGTRRFEVGARTFGAGSHYYVLDGESGEAYLFSSKLIRDLDMAQSRLMQRELHRFEPGDAASAVVAAGTKRLELTQRNRHSQQERAWVEAERPESESKTVTNWMRQLERLRALAYPGPEDEFSGDGGTTVVRIEYKDEQGSDLGFVELVKATSAPPEFFGRSEATGAWVRLSRTVGEQLESDLDSILGE